MRCTYCNSDHLVRKVRKEQLWLCEDCRDVVLNEHWKNVDDWHTDRDTQRSHEVIHKGWDYD